MAAAVAAAAAPRLSREAWLARCGVAGVRPAAVPAAPRRVAVVFWGESFRASRHGGDRRRCGAEALHAQNAIRLMHEALFARLAALGYDAFVVAATAECAADRPALDAAAALATWYGARLAAPVLAVPEMASNAGLRARALALRLLRGARAEFSHALLLRWDLAVDAAVLPACWLDSGALLDSQVLGNFGDAGDWDRAALVPVAYVDAWTCLVSADAPWLEDRSAACARDAGTHALERGAANATRCVCDDDRYVGPAPPGKCWNRRCAWDLCLNAFPFEARRPPRGCAPNATAFGAKLHHSGREKARWRTLPAAPAVFGDHATAAVRVATAVERRVDGRAAVVCVDDVVNPGDAVLAARCVDAPGPPGR